MMGLATAFYLAQKGAQVTILEKEKEVGGLSRAEEFIPGFVWDRFYHVILSTDEDLLGFLEEIGLSVDVEFTETKTGFFTDGRLHSMSTTREFLNFEPLSLWDKMRLGLGILYASKLKNPSRLEQTYAKTWLVQVFGRRNYEKMWEPLLRSKLGSAHNSASGSFIWSCITRYYGTRQKGSKKEMMGVVRGGYHSILKRIQERLGQAGVKILLGQPVVALAAADNDKLSVSVKNNGPLIFDRVIATIPNAQILELWSQAPEDFRNRLKSVRYLSLICLSMVLKRSLSPFYVTNLTDSGFPFTGFIEATHIVPPDVRGKNALVYLPRYLPPDDTYYNCDDDVIREDFFRAVKRIFADFSTQDVLASRIHREPFVQPILEVNYSRNVPAMTTPLKNFFIANTSMIQNSTLNNNQVIQVARKAADLIVTEL